MRSLLERPTYLGLTRRRLQTLYLVAAVGLAGLVPLMLFAGFWIRAELGKGQRDVEMLLDSRASALFHQVEAEVERQISALHALSALPTLDSGSEGFDETAGRMTRAMPHWTSLSLVDAATGRVVRATRTEEADAPDPESLRQAVQSRKAQIETRPGLARTGGGIHIYVPVVRNDAVALVLLMTFNALNIQDIVLAQSRNTPFTALVLDSRNRILANSSSPQPIGTDAPPAFRQAITGRNTGLFQSDLDGEPMASAFRRSRLTGWVVIASISRRESDRLMTGTALATTAAGAVSLLLAGILAVFIVHTVMERRVSEERLAASRTLGELDARLLATTQEALGEQRKAASEREVLLREIYHRVKNNLQIVQSLLRLGSRDLQAEQREPFESAVRRIGAMARVHTLLYNSPDLASIDFKDYLEELLKELSEGFGAGERGIESVLDANAMRMPLDTAVPLAFIAVEILTNAYKHAFPKGRTGQITVQVSRDDGNALLRIRDDGIGIGPDSAAKRRLGLTIVRKLVQQIGGTLEEPPPGSSVFTVRFPVEPDRPATPAAPAPVEA
ncbi:sensor histidine kinase [Enterovirga sp.]|jgi:two-component sensor histidine kinase|uniref:sensor histidine kinase n=1 Tax=Enterovirga sp. TaxID=2026350 RepID=UPI0026043CF7|nr:sensor histidine kinase [Enterovirga sp.]MDB5590018.1 hypothetical protein [Enterovirga sp.]